MSGAGGEPSPGPGGEPRRKPQVETLLHVGYHKTGTTWLQTGLFIDPTAGFTRPWRSASIRHHLVFPDGFDFDAEAAVAAFHPQLEEATAAGLVPVISDERLSGGPHAGGYDSAWIADRLAQVFPGARVLVVIREQRSAIYSTYQQYVRNGGTAPLAAYLTPRHSAEIPQFRFAHWAYHRLVARYRELFGDRLLVLPYEHLQREPGDFTATVCRFCGLQPPPGDGAPDGNRYRSLTALATALKRRANRHLVRNSLSPGAHFYVKDHEARFERLDRLLPRLLSRPLETRQRQRVAAAVGDRYRDSNRRTRELTGLDLAEWGYDL